MEMGILTAVIVAGLVNAFITQVATEDTITAPIRDWLAERERPKRLMWFINGVLGCYRCGGVWLAIPSTWIVIDRAPWNDWRTFFIVFAAASFIQFAVMTGVQRMARERLEVTVTPPE